MKDDLFRKPQHPTDFTFNQDVTAVFDDMAQRSIPFYSEVLRQSAELCDTFEISKGIIYDLGCSTGNFAAALLQQFGRRKFHYCGIDASPTMVAEAAKRFASEKKRITFSQWDISSVDLTGAGAIVANYTLQFVRPLERLPLVAKIYRTLPHSGVFIMSEKVLEQDSDVSRLFHELYYDFKQKNGYTKLEISRKREALENVMIPYRLEENIELIKSAGFADVHLFFKWYNFASFVAVKK